MSKWGWAGTVAGCGVVAAWFASVFLAPARTVEVSTGLLSLLGAALLAYGDDWVILPKIIADSSFRRKNAVGLPVYVALPLSLFLVGLGLLFIGGAFTPSLERFLLNLG